MFLVTLMARENSEDFKGIYGSLVGFESSMSTNKKNNKDGKNAKRKKL